MSTTLPAPRTTCSATSTAAGWRTTPSRPTGPPTARSAHWPTAPRSRCATSSRGGAPSAAEGHRPQRIGDLYASFIDYRHHRASGACARYSTSWPASTPRRPRPSWRRARRAAATGVGGGPASTSTPTRRTPPATCCTFAVRARAARRVVLPRRAARVILAAYPTHIARMFALVYGEHDRRLGERPPPGSSPWRPRSPPRTGTWSSAATPT